MKGCQVREKTTINAPLFSVNFDNLTPAAYTTELQQLSQSSSIRFSKPHEQLPAGVTSHPLKIRDSATTTNGPKNVTTLESFRLPACSSRGFGAHCSETLLAHKFSICKTCAIFFPWGHVGTSPACLAWLRRA